MSELLQAQQRFVFMLGQLIQWAVDHGYGLTEGEGERPQAVAALYAREGKGIKDSLHCLKLAHDFNVFKGGLYLTSGEQYLDLIEFWEQLGGAAGYRFGDDDHFSLSFGGRE
jgi:hypothetical protein